MTSRCRRGSLLPLSCTIWILLGVAGSATAQLSNNEKLVRCNDPAHITDAVMISDISVAGKTIECGLFIKPPAVVQPVSPFQASSDWLQQMTISLINRTNKTIVFGAIELVFLDTGDCRSLPCTAYPIHLGQMPAMDAYDGRTGLPLKPEQPERAALDWKPGQTITIHVNDYFAQIEGVLSRSMPVTAVAKVAVHIGPFFFEDGMRWSLGRYSVPDAEHPGKFKYLPADYFPGRRGNNWPPGYNQ